MKKLILLSCTALLSVSIAHAQKGYGMCEYGTPGSKVPTVSNQANPPGNDTLTQYFDRCSGQALYYPVNAPLSGFIFGSGYDADGNPLFKSSGMHYDGIEDTREFKEAGEHELRIDFNIFPSGNYYYTIFT